jgi:CheY-like chemotaxis protein
MKTALIVDDSRVARAVLRKTLIGFGVDVDEVPTAEAAIEYLKVDSPDVIFLDHMMPGMDGFDALSALKANPSTATIPVLMYTSQEGQFYVSQARALGALDILPKSLAPADVERILRSHHLIGEPRWTLIDGEEPASDGYRALIEQFRSMLDDQAAVLTAEFRRELARAESASEERFRLVLTESKLKSTPSFSLPMAAGFSVAAIALVVSIGVPKLPEPKTSEEVPEPAAVITMHKPVATPALDTDSLAFQVAEAERSAIADARANDWNTTVPYAYGAIPLDDALAREYALLFAELKGDGFSGTVTFDIYQGRHCMNYSADGSIELAPPNQPAPSCDYIGAPPPESNARLQSPMFANLVASATRDGRITVDTLLHGTTEPLIEYPSLDYTVTAADWNSIADVNQRVSMRVTGEGAVSPRVPFAYLGQ